MLLLLSPSKTQDFDTPSPVKTFSEPVLLAQSKQLVAALQKLSAKEIGKLMDISEKLSALNYERYQSFSLPFTPQNAKQAMFAFQGDVYDGLDAASLSKPTITYAQKHLRILSGLYGIIRPLDLIQPYRLEMKIRLKTAKAKDLYHFWGSRLTDTLNETLQQESAPLLVNLASEEYFSAVVSRALVAPVITPQFKEKKGKEYKMIGLFAKRARGQMARYILIHQLTKAEEIQGFEEDGYRYNAALSKKNIPVFTRG